MKTTATIMTTSPRAGMVEMAMMTKRRLYWTHLHAIADITGELNRRMSFKEAADWLNAYTWFANDGWPTEHAAQRSYDCMFNARRGMLV